MFIIDTHNLKQATLEALLHGKNAPDQKNRAKLIEQIKEQGLNPDTWAAQYYVNFLEGEGLESTVYQNDRIMNLGMQEKAASKIPSMRILQQFCDTEECYEYAAALAKKFPHLTMDSGFYVKPDGKAADHAWCVAPDGTIVDTTHGQFNPRMPILIAKPSSPLQKRYRSWKEHHNPNCLHKELKLDYPCALTAQGNCDHHGQHQTTEEKMRQRQLEQK